jgi:hypothetical protein
MFKHFGGQDLQPHQKALVDKIVETYLPLVKKI